jgi:ABC-type transporter Mla subunit MlaD
MALQDLTPQLRTRLSRVERVVGIFVIFATLLLLTGFVYYLYNTAQRKGWFLTRAPFFIFVGSADGLKVGDPIKLMGFDVGEVTKIEPMPPSDPMFNVYVEFRIRSPYYGYMWTDSHAKLTAGDFLGHRFLEVTKGTNGVPTYEINHGQAVSPPEAREQPITGVWDDDAKAYKPITKQFEVWQEKQHKYKFSPYWLRSDESPALADRLEMTITQVETNLPGVLNLTNYIAQTLTNTSRMVAHLDDLLVRVQPVVTNLVAISTQLTNGQGALGDYLVPSKINEQLQGTLATANTILHNTDTNLNTLTLNLNRTLVNLAEITGNLNTQVQANSLMLSEISSLVVNADDFLQGLKRNWLLKASFAGTTNQPIQSILKPSVGGTR